jgi:hypothetical protein
MEDIVAAVVVDVVAVAVAVAVVVVSWSLQIWKELD